MKLTKAILAGTVLAAAWEGTYAQAVEGTEYGGNGRDLKGGGKKAKKKSAKYYKLTLKVTNLTYQQVFSPFFVMTHSSAVPPLYEFGGEASPELRTLAEDGNPDPLIALYRDFGKHKALASRTGGPIPPGKSYEIEVTLSKKLKYVTIASMAVNTNDCFMAINGKILKPGDKLVLPGLDAGTEVNDENCNNVPGPLCDGKGTQDGAPGGGEEFVHVHRGVQGIGDLDASGADWRNPMMLVEVMYPDGW